MCFVSDGNRLLRLAWIRIEQNPDPSAVGQRQLQDTEQRIVRRDLNRRDLRRLEHTPIKRRVPEAACRRAVQFDRVGCEEHTPTPYTVCYEEGLTVRPTLKNFRMVESFNADAGLVRGV